MNILAMALAFLVGYLGMRLLTQNYHTGNKKRIGIGFIVALILLVILMTSCSGPRMTQDSRRHSDNIQQSTDGMPDYKAGFVNDNRDTLYLPSNSFGGQICDSWDIDPEAWEEKWPVFVFVDEEEIERLWLERKGLVVECIRMGENAERQIPASTSSQLTSKQPTNK